MPASAIVRRSSFLKRNPALTPEEFGRHYETVHGPLAAGLAGFRKYTLRYVQNHVEQAGGIDMPFDGITMTTQVAREDYSRGFFHEPDYEKVKEDELYLFDMGRTVSVLSRIVGGPPAPRQGRKAVFLAGAGWQPPPILAMKGLLAHSLARNDPGSASALGFRGAAFDHPFTVEAWFSTAEAREETLRQASKLFGEGTVALPVREILIFGPELPWRTGP